MKNKGDLERDRDELKAEIESHNNKVQVLERTIEHLKKIIDEKVSKYKIKLQPNLNNVNAQNTTTTCFVFYSGPQSILSLLLLNI